MVRATNFVIRSHSLRLGLAVALILCSLEIFAICANLPVT
jgi:hypothetical protein